MRITSVGNPYLCTSSAVHAVTEITAGGTTQTLNYDDNGNLNSGDDVPGIYWSTYNKPLWLAKGSVYNVFNYGPDRQRYRKFHGDDTTYYIGNGFERTNSPTGMSFRHIVRANGRAIMLRKDSTGGTANHQYIHRDHLGSVTALTRETDGSVIERYSYDAWGQRRSADTWLPATITAYEQRGYTGHEHLDDIGIIHMNGRIYDPRLGRMLSPDPVTQAPENGQNYNRYTYAYNNPLNYTDPSGYETKKKTVLVDGNSAHSAGGMEHVYVTASAPSPRFVGNQAALTFAGNNGNSPRNAPGDRVETNGAPKPSQAPVDDDDPVTNFDESTCENTGCVTVYGLRGGGQLSLGAPSIFRRNGAASKSRFVTFPWFKARNFDTGETLSGRGYRSNADAGGQAITGGALILGAGAVGGTCLAFPSACYASVKLAIKGIATGSVIRGFTGQPVSANSLMVDAALGVIVGAPFSALGAVSGPIGKWIWEFNGHTATAPMDLPSP